MSGVLAVVTARGGSKGLPRKNLLPLGGVPLIVWTVRAALNANCVARVVVSTDDDEISNVALAAGAEVPFRRPAALASDAASSVDVMLHALEVLKWNGSVVMLQPTSPFRTSRDLDAGFAQWCNAPGAGSCVSVCEATTSPWLMFREGPSGRLDRLLPEPRSGLRRQDLHGFAWSRVLF